MLDPRAVAVQGIGFTPPFVALQGFVVPEVVSARRPRTHGVRFEPYRPVEMVSLAQLRAEDELVTDLLIALVTKGFFDG